MKEYMSIPKYQGESLGSLYCFDKLDGSSVRAEVNRKGQITKFGKRHGLLDSQTPFLIEAATLIPKIYGDQIGKLVVDSRWESATFFFEFYGASSFAGTHVAEPHTVTLFDIDVYKKGLMEAKDFLRLCENAYIEHARLLHTGPLSLIAKEVEEGTLPGMTFEGVVAKGPKDRKTGLPFMCKLKSKVWIARLRDKCEGNDALFQKLV